MKTLSEYELQELEEIMDGGRTVAVCEHCGREATVEPDGDYDCPECGIGKLRSPIVLLAMI